MIGVASTTEFELVKNVSESGKSKLRVPKTKLEPISAEILSKLSDMGFFSV